MFHFKQFNIDDTLCAMKVGTDGVLLGAWADVSEAGRILDAGCGSGLIALMVAQRNAKARITAIDIDEGAINQSVVNVQASPWAERIEVLLADLRTYSLDEHYDHIVSNPPFFNEALFSPTEQRAVARHSLSGGKVCLNALVKEVEAACTVSVDINKSCGNVVSLSIDDLVRGELFLCKRGDPAVLKVKVVADEYFVAGYDPSVFNNGLHISTSSPWGSVRE